MSILTISDHDLGELLHDIVADNQDGPRLADFGWTEIARQLKAELMEHEAWRNEPAAKPSPAADLANQVFADACALNNALAKTRRGST